MKNMDGIYEKFTPVERVALLVEALARKDLSEADKLVDTCEMKTYRMADAAYQQRLQVIHLAALHARLLLDHHFAISLAGAGIVAHCVDKSDRKSKKLFSESVEKLLSVDSQIRGVWCAWKDFCTEASVDPVKVMEATWGPVPEHYESGCAKVLLGLECEPADPDPDAYKMAIGLFRHGLEIVERNYGGASSHPGQSRRVA